MVEITNQTSVSRESTRNVLTAFSDSEPGHRWIQLSRLDTLKNMCTASFGTNYLVSWISTDFSYLSLSIVPIPELGWLSSLMQGSTGRCFLISGGYVGTAVGKGPIIWEMVGAGLDNTTENQYTSCTVCWILLLVCGQFGSMMFFTFFCLVQGMASNGIKFYLLGVEKYVSKITIIQMISHLKLCCFLSCRAGSWFWFFWCG